MKRYLYIVFCLFVAGTACAQSLLTPEQLAKREKRKNLTVKEWNTDSKTKTRWLDRVKVYDAQGRCIEEIEYATYGQKWRITYEYTDAVGGKVLKEVEYNDKTFQIIHSAFSNLRNQHNVLYKKHLFPLHHIHQ